MTELSIRIPVIPGFNDTPEEIRDIAVFTRELGHVKRLHLLLITGWDRTNMTV